MAERLDPPASTLEHVSTESGKAPAGANRTPIFRTPSDSPAGSGPKHSIQWGLGPEFSGVSALVSERTVGGGLAVGGWVPHTLPRAYL